MTWKWDFAQANTTMQTVLIRAEGDHPDSYSTMQSHINNQKLPQILRSTSRGKWISISPRYNAIFVMSTAKVQQCQRRWLLQTTDWEACGRKHSRPVWNCYKNH